MNNPVNNYTIWRARARLWDKSVTPIVRSKLDQPNLKSGIPLVLDKKRAHPVVHELVEPPRKPREQRETTIVKLRPPVVYAYRSATDFTTSSKKNVISCLKEINGIFVHIIPYLHSRIFRDNLLQKKKK